MHDVRCAVTRHGQRTRFTVAWVLSILLIGDATLAQSPAPGVRSAPSGAILQPIEGRTLTPGDEVEFQPFRPITASVSQEIVFSQTTRLNVRAWSIAPITIRRRPTATNPATLAAGFVVPQLPAGSYDVAWKLAGEHGPKSTVTIQPKLVSFIDDTRAQLGEIAAGVRVVGPLERPKSLGTGTVVNSPNVAVGVHQPDRSFLPTVSVKSMADPAHVRLAHAEPSSRPVDSNGTARFRFLATDAGGTVTLGTEGFPDVRITLPAGSKSVVIPPDGPEQAPVIYVHGFKDDGTPWARGTLYTVEDLFSPIGVKYAQHYGSSQRSPAAFLAEHGIESWAVQWWSLDAEGDPNTTHAGGFAFLADAEQLRRQTNWVTGDLTPQNYPIPSALDVLLAPTWDLQLVGNPLAIAALVPLGPDIVKAYVAAQLPMRNTYNDSGRAAEKAHDLLEMLTAECAPGGRLAAWSQVNIVAHSQGGLVTRTMLANAAKAGDGREELVANVIYNAPPFGGSTLAHVGTLVFGTKDLTADLFADPQLNLALGTSVGTAGELLRNLMERLLRPLGVGWSMIESVLPPAVALALAPLDSWTIEYDHLSDLTRGDLRPAGEAIANCIELLRPVASHFLGLPGFPAIGADLTPQAGVDHLTSVSTTKNSRQFVTLGHGGIGTWLFPSNLAAVADRPALIVDAAANIAGPDDDAVTDGSARLLTTTDRFGPRMSLLGVFDRFNHGDMVYSRVHDRGTSKGIGRRWLDVLLAAPTSLVVSGAVDHSDTGSRRIVVTKDAWFGFKSSPVTRGTVEVAAVRHEYRVRSEETTPGAWQELALGATVMFGDLVDRLQMSTTAFHLDWRSVNAAEGREIIRSAEVVVDGGAAAIGLPRTAQSAGDRGRLARPNGVDLVAEGRGDLLVTAAASQVEARWNNGPTVVAVPDAVKRSIALDVSRLAEGTHSLQMAVRNDPARTQRTFSVLVDRTPPKAILRGGYATASRRIVGPDSWLVLDANDAGCGVANAAATLPDGRSVRSGEFFRVAPDGLPVTSIAVTAEDAVGNRTVKTFEMQQDFTPPVLEVSDLGGATPRDTGHVSVSPEVTLSMRVADADAGIADVRFDVISPAGRVTADGRLQPGLRNTGLFAGRIPLSAGRNIVVVTARDRVGNRGVLTLDITHEGAPAPQVGRRR